MLPTDVIEMLPKVLKSFEGKKTPKKQEDTDNNNLLF